MMVATFTTVFAEDENNTSTSEEITEKGNNSSDIDELENSDVSTEGEKEESKGGVITYGEQSTDNNGSEVVESESEEIPKQNEILTISDNEEQSDSENITLSYSAHVQDIGWMSEVSSNETAGTTGKSKNLEALKISLSDGENPVDNISVEAHAQDYGWLDAVGNNEVAGTTGQGKRLEAVKMSLTGDLANTYDIYYRVHVGNIGWLGWAKNGDIAGSVGCNRRLEAVQIAIYKKGDSSAPETGSATYEKPTIENIGLSFTTNAHVQDYGWLSVTGNSQVIGTTGQSKRLEALKLSITEDMSCYGDISVQSHVQDYGWMSAVNSGNVSGTTGQGKRLEAVKISLTGDLANTYDIYYRVHVGNIGWLGWAKNGDIAGSVGCNRRLEAVQIAIYKKGDSNAPQTGNSITTSVEVSQYTPTYYSQRDSRWSGATYNGYSLYSTGCVPTSVAMAVDGILHNGVTPNIMADYLVTTGEFAGRKHGGSGLAIKYGAEHWGLKTNGIGSYNDLVNSLNAGKIVVFQVGAGTFTSRGSTHAIVLFRSSGGNTYVYDPWNAHNGWYSISMIWDQRSTNSYDLTGGYVGYGISK